MQLATLMKEFLRVNTFQSQNLILVTHSQCAPTMNDSFIHILHKNKQMKQNLETEHVEKNIQQINMISQLLSKLSCFGCQCLKVCVMYSSQYYLYLVSIVQCLSFHLMSLGSFFWGSGLRNLDLKFG